MCRNLWIVSRLWLGLRKITRKFDVVSGSSCGRVSCVGLIGVVCWLVCVSYLLDQS